MKKRLIVIALISSSLLIGCTSKDASINTTASNGQASQTSKALASGLEKQRVEVKTDFKPVKPDSVPKLSSQQKSQLNSQLNSTLKNIDGTLNSLQDAPDINLSSVKN